MKVSRHEAKRGALRRRLEARHLIVLACFLATLSAYVERVGFSIAYTAMAKIDKVDEAAKGTVLSAFYWGYGVSQVNLAAFEPSLFNQCDFLSTGVCFPACRHVQLAHLNMCVGPCMRVMSIHMHIKMCKHICRRRHCSVPLVQRTIHSACGTGSWRLGCTALGRPPHAHGFIRLVVDRLNADTRICS